jgi:hypothetical protein
MYSLGVLFVACLSGIAAAGTSGSPPVTDPAADPVTPGLAALWAACLGASPRDRPSAAHVAFMSRQALAARPAAARAEGEPGQASIEPRRGTDGRGHAREGAADERAAPVPVGRWVPDGAPGGPGANGGPPDRPGRGSGPGRGQHGRTGPGTRRTPRDRLGMVGRGRARVLAFGAAAATGIAVAAVVLTQFLTSPAAQTTGASATPSAHVTASRPAGTARTAHPLPSADASSSVLASASPPPIQVLDQIQATVRHGVTSGQIRQDVGVDLSNLLQPVQADLAAGNTAGVAQLAGALKAKLAARLGEGAITRAAVAELDRELATLVKSVNGPG